MHRKIGRSILDVIPVKALTRYTPILLSLAILALAGCSYFSSTEADSGGGGGKGKGKGKGGGGGAGGAQPVLVATASRKDVPIEITPVGNAEAFTTVSVKSLVTGELTDFFFKEGDYVRKGDKLFTIDSRTYEAAIKQAEANLLKDRAQQTLAEANLNKDTASQQYSRATAERYQGLLKDGIVSRDQTEQLTANAAASLQSVDADRAAIESAKAQIEADQANIANLKIQLSYCVQPATLDGRTGNVAVKKGNIVSANTTEILTINQVSPIYVTFSVPEAKLNDIRKYMALGKLPVFAKSQNEVGSGEEGYVTFIDNSVDLTTGTIKIKGTFENKDLKLWPGQFLNVTLRLTTQMGAITVPNEAVQNGQDGQFVYVVKSDNHVEARPVTIGERIDQDLVVLKGLEPGETVVTQGQLRLQPGSLVSIGEGAPTGGGGKGSGGRGGGRGKQTVPVPDGGPGGRKG
jgi:multidrug efflux system membrane fusion protein